MATPEPKPELEMISFETKELFYDWLSKNHDKSPGIWLRMYKKASGIPSIAWAGAVEVGLCFGWIDSIAKGYDEVSHIQRFTPRRAKSIWSKKNRETVDRLVAEGLMQSSGLAQVEAAKADGRWDAAYDSPKDTKVPDDFIEALKAHPKAQETFATLNKTNLYTISFNLMTARKPETRQRRMDKLIETLNKGEKFH